MTNQNNRRSLGNLILAMSIFGTIGILRKYVQMPSTFIALFRAIIGTGFLWVILRLRKQPLDLSAIKRDLILLILSSTAMAFNWIFLFEAYNYTTVTTATLCYYMAPTIMVVASHFLFGEDLGLKKLLCVAAALLGMVLISGVVGSGIPSPSELKGILFGLAAALLYACVILINKKIRLESAYDRTILQLGIASIVLIPYTLLTADMSTAIFDPMGIIFLILIGMVHTGFAYSLYFGSVKDLPTRTVALMSYIDPILAIVLSALILREPMGLEEIIGSAMILGAAYISEK